MDLEKTASRGGLEKGSRACGPEGLCMAHPSGRVDGIVLMVPRGSLGDVSTLDCDPCFTRV